MLTWIGRTLSPGFAYGVTAACGAAVLSTSGVAAAHEGDWWERDDKARDHAVGLGSRSSAPEPEENNAMYLEALGAGFFDSFNYERRYESFAGRVGIGVMPLGGTSASSSSAAYTMTWIAVPVTVSYLGIGNRVHTLEVGAGATYFHESGDPRSSTTGGGVYADAMLGYRLQPAHTPGSGGFLLRAGLDMVLGFRPESFLPWPHLALGFTFR